MTITVEIKNTESPEDRSKELIVEVCRLHDWSPQTKQTLKGEQKCTVSVWPEQGIRLSERWSDKASTSGERQAEGFKIAEA